MNLPSDHAKGSHGMAGLYFKYDVSALKVIVKPDQEGFMHFLIRISSVIAGIIVISGDYFTIIYHIQLINKLCFQCSFSGYLNSLIQLVCDFLIRKVSPQTYQQLHNPTTNADAFDTKPVQPSSQHPNHLITNANQMAESNFNFTVKQ